MDDTAQKINGSQDGSTQAQPVIAPFKPSADSTQEQKPPTVGTINKESGVRANVEVSNKPPTIDKEASEFVRESEPKVPHAPEAGYKAAADATPVPTAPSGSVQLPDALPNEEEALKTIKEESNKLETDIGSHQEGIYFLPSKLGLAVLKVKQVLTEKLFGKKADK